MLSTFELTLYELFCDMPNCEHSTSDHKIDPLDEADTLLDRAERTGWFFFGAGLHACPCHDEQRGQLKGQEAIPL